MPGYGPPSAASVPLTERMSTMIFAAFFASSAETVGSVLTPTSTSSFCIAATNVEPAPMLTGCSWLTGTPLCTAR